MTGYPSRSSFKCVSAEAKTKVSFLRDEIEQFIGFEIQPKHGALELETGGSQSEIDGSIFLWRGQKPWSGNSLAYIKATPGDDFFGAEPEGYVIGVNLSEDLFDNVITMISAGWLPEIEFGFAISNEDPQFVGYMWRNTDFPDLEINLFQIQFPKIKQLEDQS